MKKLSFAMALIMILAICASTLGVTAFAADPVYAADTVAVLTDGTTSTEYNNLADAFAAYKGGETLTIVKDIEIAEGAITVEGKTTTLADDMTTMTTVAKDTLTINGNGKTVTFVNVNDYAITLESVNAVISNLTVKSNKGGIKAAGQSSLILNDCNVLASGTSLDSHIEGDYTGGGVAVMQDNNNKGYVEINGGTYKAAGTRTSEQVEKEGQMTTKYTYASTSVMDIRYGRVVLNNPTVIGYYSDIAVQVGEAAVPEIGEEGVTCAGWINGGTYMLYNSDMKKSNSVCVRAYRGALLTIFDGDFIVYNVSGTNGAAVIGTHSAGGTYTYVLGGKFYNLSTNVNSILIGHNAAKNAISNMEAAMYFHMYGGEFYSSIVADRVEHNLDGETSVIRNKSDYTLDKKANATVADPKTGVDINVNSWKYDYKYDATNAKADAKIKVQNGDNVYYADTLWQAVNALADDGATVTLLDNITVDKEIVFLARDAKITLDLNGKTITTADGVKNALLCQMGDITVKNGTIANASGSAFNFGYSPIDFGDNEFEEVEFANYNVNVTLNAVALTSNGDAYVTQCVNKGTLTFEGACTVNGNAPAAATVDIAGMPARSDDTTGGDTSGDDTTGDTNTGDTNTGDTNTGDTPADTTTSANEEKKGCGSSIGIGAVAVLAVAGLACGVASKKRED